MGHGSIRTYNASSNPKILCEQVLTEKAFPNHVRTVADLQHGKPMFDASKALDISYVIFLELKGKGSLQPPSHVGQCDCGQLFLVPTNCANDKDWPRSETGLLCADCGDYDAKITMPIPGTNRVRKGIADFRAMLLRAKTDNNFTLAWYLWESLQKFTPRLYEIQRLANVLYQLHIRNLLQLIASRDGIGAFRFDIDLIKDEDYMIQLLLLNHVIEAHEIYDILITLSRIARSELFLIRDDGMSVNYGVGASIQFEEDENDRLAARLKLLRREILCGKNIAFANLLKRSLNTDVRNAFSHSEYEIRGNEVFLTKYNRSVSEEALGDAFIGAYYILETLVQFIESERDAFIASKGLEEGGWKLTAEENDDRMSLQLSSSSPLCQPTGRVRRARLGIEPVGEKS